MKVSIYCTVYNHEKYLCSALDGFVSQETDFDYEVFVHDDASTDGSAKIIKEYAEKYPDIIKQICQTENQYSKGINIFSEFLYPHMTGEYIAVCEGDDYWSDKQKLKKQVEFLDKHMEYAACVHNTKKIDLWKRKEYDMYPWQASKDLEFSEIIQDGGSCYHTSSLMYRAKYASEEPDFFKKAKGYGDYPTAIYLALSGKIRFLKDVMSVYRFGTEGSWSKRTAVDTSKIIHVVDSKIDMLHAVNKYSDYRYNSDIKEVILKHQYMIHEMSGEYDALRKEPYKRYYNKKPFTYKVKVYLKQGFYKPYVYLRKNFYGRKV